MFGSIGNKVMNYIARISGAYTYHPEAVIISCFYNPTRSEYRTAAFETYYQSIKHLNHIIIECAIGLDDFQLDPDNFEAGCLRQVRAKSLLWHKETLINQVMADLSGMFQYIFWLDADVIFTNRNWLVEAVAKMKAGATIVQPFEYCVHLEKDETSPSFDVDAYRDTASSPTRRHPGLWRSFAANWSDRNEIHDYSYSNNYDVHGHVGFAWGATRHTLMQSNGLYDKALIGGADHIMAHAAVGQIPSECVNRGYEKADIADIFEWSKTFYEVTGGRLEYVSGDLYHIWHGDIKNRQYLKRIQDFAPISKTIKRNPVSGFHEVEDVAVASYMTNYFAQREDTSSTTPLDTNFLNTSDDTPDTPPSDAFFVSGGGGGESGGGGASGDYGSPTDTAQSSSDGMLDSNSASDAGSSNFS